MKLYTGRQIRYRASKSLHLTENLSAEDALKAIKGKYNTVKDTAHYYHKGHGELVKTVKW